jgi:hypothetical protein
MITLGTYVAKKDLMLTYDVGRAGLGEVSYKITEGEVIKAQPIQDKLRFNAVHTVNGKHYSTPVFLDPSSFSEATGVKSLDPLFNKKDVKRMIILALGLSFGLLISRK